MSLRELTKLSRRYGADGRYVAGGGGNSSWKNEDQLYIKRSGIALADITEEGFVKMERKKLASIWGKTYPESNEERESLVLADLMAARSSGEENKRPSVETLLHELLPYPFVVHTHPALVNGLCCSLDGEKAARALFGDKFIWIPSIDPGYVLALAVKEASALFHSRYGRDAAIIFLQNHGIFVAADTPMGIDEVYEEVMGAIANKVSREPDRGNALTEFGDSKELGEVLARLAGKNGTSALGTKDKAFVFFRRDKEIARFCSDRATFAPLTSAFTPDHIVYAGPAPLFIDAGERPSAGTAVALIERAWLDYNAQHGVPPKIAAVRGLGVFGIGLNAKSATLALDLFSDSIKVAIYAEAFGGPLFMTPERIAFITGWEVEHYRSAILSE